jgi:mono/diheme cytochrome c family protein
MSRWVRIGGALLAITVGACGSAGGDAVKGEQLHRACFGCHGTELYTPDRAKIRTSAELRKAVIEWNDRMNPKFTKEEIDDVVAYLERDFYRFPKKD